MKAMSFNFSYDVLEAEARRPVNVEVSTPSLLLNKDSFQAI